MKRLVIFIFIFPELLFAQRLFTLEIKSNTHSEIVDKISYKRSFTSKTERSKEIQNVLFSLYDNAYLAAEIESPSLPDSLDLVVYINTGVQYKWMEMKQGKLDESILREVNSPLLRRGARGEAGKPFYYK